MSEAQTKLAANPFAPIYLETRSGDHVATVMIPRMQPPPDAVQWGARMFFKSGGDSYREGIIWFVPPEMTEPGA
jgi:hypothetical protein